PLRVDRGRPLLRPLRIPDRPPAPARAAAHRLGEGAAVPAPARPPDLALVLRLGRVSGPRAREVARHLAGPRLSLQLHPGPGGRRLVALDRGAVLPGGPAAPPRGSAVPRATWAGLGSPRPARADAHHSGGDPGGGGGARHPPHLRAVPHPL